MGWGGRASLGPVGVDSLLPAPGMVYRATLVESSTVVDPFSALHRTLLRGLDTDQEIKGCPCDVWYCEMENQ